MVKTNSFETMVLCIVSKNCKNEPVGLRQNKNHIIIVTSKGGVVITIGNPYMFFHFKQISSEIIR